MIIQILHHIWERIFSRKHYSHGWKRISNPPQWVTKKMFRMPLKPFTRYYIKGRHRVYKGVFNPGKYQGGSYWLYYCKRR